MRFAHHGRGSNFFPGLLHKLSVNYKGETNLRGRSASMAGRPVAGTHGSLGKLYEPRLSPPCV